jgi:hypothetical protein
MSEPFTRSDGLPVENVIKTADNEDIHARTRARRRIDAGTVEAISRFVAQGLTESAACHELGIRPKQWFNWKAKHSRDERFTQQLADLVGHRMSVIEKATLGKHADWRAAAHLLAIIDPERFAVRNRH